MRNLARNKRTVHFKVYTGETAVEDAAHLLTGEYTYTYGTLTSVKAYISPSRGDASSDPFGINLDYTNIMIVDDMTCTLNESSLLWVDAPAVDGQGNELPNDYIVKKVAKSFNCIQYAIRKVDVS